MCQGFNTPNPCVQEPAVFRRGLTSEAPWRVALELSGESVPSLGLWAMRTGHGGGDGADAEM